jgi:hypothetical protein
MKSANLESSDRLQRVRDVLMDMAEHSTRDIVRNANVLAVNSAIAELRANGLNITCTRKGPQWFYRMGE